MIVYVDGFNLYNGMHDRYSHQFLWLDVVKLSQSLRPRSSLLKVRYFTAPVLNQPAAQSRQDNYLKALEAAHPNEVEIYLGRYQSKTRECRVCGAQHVVYEEKETDVNMAVNLLADVGGNKADAFFVITADSDIVPAVKMARELNPQAFIAAAFPPKRYSAELAKLMPSSLHIGRSKLAQALLPTTVTAQNGQVHTRPSKWH